MLSLARLPVPWAKMHVDVGRVESGLGECHPVAGGDSVRVGSGGVAGVVVHRGGQQLRVRRARAAERLFGLEDQETGALGRGHVPSVLRERTARDGADRLEGVEADQVLLGVGVDAPDHGGVGDTGPQQFQRAGESHVGRGAGVVHGEGGTDRADGAGDVVRYGVTGVAARFTGAAPARDDVLQGIRLTVAAADTHHGVAKSRMPGGEPRVGQCLQGRVLGEERGRAGRPVRRPVTGERMRTLAGRVGNPATENARLHPRVDRLQFLEARRRRAEVVPQAVLARSGR